MPPSTTAAPQGASGSFAASHTIPEDAIAPAPPLGMPLPIVPPSGDSIGLELTRGVPPTPPSTTQPPVRQPPPWAAGLPFGGASGGIASGGGMSSGILPPTPANSEALLAGGSSGILTPTGDAAGAPPAMAVPPPVPMVSASDVAHKLSSPEVTAPAARVQMPLGVRPGDQHPSPALPVHGALAPPPLAHFPSDAPEESIEILEISASLPLANAQAGAQLGGLGMHVPQDQERAYAGGPATGADPVAGSANPFAMPAMQSDAGAQALSAEARNVFVPGEPPAGMPWGRGQAGAQDQGTGAGQGAGFGSGVTGKANWTSF